MLTTLLFMGGCNIFKAKKVVNDTQKLATDVEKLEKDAGPDAVIVLADGKQLVSDLKGC